MKKEYIAPESNVMEMNAEGVLCASGETEVKGASIQTWTENTTSIW